MSNLIQMDVCPILGGVCHLTRGPLGPGHNDLRDIHSEEGWSPNIIDNLISITTTIFLVSGIVSPRFLN